MAAAKRFLKPKKCMVSFIYEPRFFINGIFVNEIMMYIHASNHPHFLLGGLIFLRDHTFHCNEIVRQHALNVFYEFILALRTLP